MHDLGFISDKQYEAAQKETLVIKRDLSDYPVHAEFVAEWPARSPQNASPTSLFPRPQVYHRPSTGMSRKAAYRQPAQGRHGLRPAPRLPGAEAFVDMAQIILRPGRGISTRPSRTFPDAGDPGSRAWLGGQSRRR